MSAPSLSEDGQGLVQPSSSKTLDTVTGARHKRDTRCGASGGNNTVPMIPHRPYSLVREVLEAAAEGTAKRKQPEAEAKKAAEAKRFGGT